MKIKDCVTSLMVSLAVLIGVISLPTGAVAADRPSYQQLEGKASRAYDYGEWASASALYGLMIDDRPTESWLYGRAIVAAAMRDKPAEEVELLRRALASHVPFDTVFAGVQRESFAIGQSDLYENFMKEVRSAEPWLKRTINGYLLRYYSYRRNPSGMIDYARELLEAVPDNEPFLYTLASGYLQAGQYEEAVATWQRIVGLNPRAYDALLYLGNYFADRVGSDPSARAVAEGYLAKANELRPTPYVSKKLHLLASKP